MMITRHTLEGGQRIVNVHSHDQCRGRVCPIHNMTDHPFRVWRQRWLSEAQIMQRVCEHDVSHPDPDDLLGKDRWEHTCDGCCKPITDEAVAEAVAALKEMRHHLS